MYDIYTPLAKETHGEYSYEQSMELVKKGLAVLGGEYGALLQEAQDGGWIDVYETPGKTSGAYSWGVFGVHPYVLLNHRGDLDSVFTIAHELGHSMHTFYSDKNQAFLNSEYPLFLAEIASTTNEAILLSSLKEKFTRRDQRMALCNYQLEQIRGTVYRQTLFAEFEREVHAMAMRGEALTAEALTAVYRRLNEVYYKGAVVDDDIAIEWMRIPHFYRAFYVLAPRALGRRAQARPVPRVPGQRQLQAPAGDAAPGRRGHGEPRARRGVPAQLRGGAGRDGTTHGGGVNHAGI